MCIFSCIQIAVCCLRGWKDLPRSQGWVPGYQGQHQHNMHAHHMSWSVYEHPLTLWSGALISITEVLKDTEKHEPHSTGNGRSKMLPCSRSLWWKFAGWKHEKVSQNRPKHMLQRKATTQNIWLEIKIPTYSISQDCLVPQYRSINASGTLKNISFLYNVYILQYSCFCHS